MSKDPTPDAVELAEAISRLSELCCQFDHMHEATTFRIASGKPLRLGDLRAALAALKEQSR
jgi:hypothetical protein